MHCLELLLFESKSSASAFFGGEFTFLFVAEASERVALEYD